MLNFPIIDAHLHLWNPELIDYPWLSADPLMNRKFLLEDYKSACGNIKVDKMVFIQCECSQDQYLKEVNWITGLAQADKRIQAIIPWAPLEMGEKVRPILEDMSKNPLVKGIRRIIEFEKDINFCLQPGFVRGVQLLSEYGFSFDINIDHTQLPNTIKLVKQCPEVMFILNHAAKPDIKNNVHESWKKEISQLAAMPNVYCKLSHLVNKADHDSWTTNDLKPYISDVIEAFGEDRTAFASDWPVCTAASDIPRWMDALLEAVNWMNETQLHKLFYSNAAKFYRI